jgi:hypothetical protein
MIARRPSHSALRRAAVPFWIGALLAGAQSAAAQGCDGVTTGSVILNERAAVVFMAAFAGEHAYLDVVFLARGDAGWNAHDTTLEPWLRSQLPEATGYLTGVGFGKLFFQYDQKAGNAWVHTQKVPVRRGAVLLVEQAHTLTPGVRTVTHIDPLIPLTDACGVRANSDHVTLRKAIFQMLLNEQSLHELLKELSPGKTSS